MVIVGIQEAFFGDGRVFQKARLDLEPRANRKRVDALSHKTGLSTYRLTSRCDGNNEISLARQSVEQALQCRKQHDYQRGTLLSGNAFERLLNRRVDAPLPGSRLGGPDGGTGSIARKLQRRRQFVKLLAPERHGQPRLGVTRLSGD